MLHDVRWMAQPCPDSSNDHHLATQLSSAGEHGADSGPWNASKHCPFFVYSLRGAAHNLSANLKACHRSKRIQGRVLMVTQGAPTGCALQGLHPKDLGTVQRQRQRAHPLSYQWDRVRRHGGEELLRAWYASPIRLVCMVLTRGRRNVWQFCRSRRLAGHGQAVVRSRHVLIRLLGSGLLTPFTRNADACRPTVG